jgi:phage nucleotide-binding protein
MKIKQTNELTNAGVKVLVYGASGAGKTTLISSLADCIVLSAEGGLLSLSKFNIPYIEITDMETLEEAYQWFSSSKEASQFKSVALDSISEIAEVVLAAEKAKSRDPRAAYGNMQDIMTGYIRKFRDLSERHVYFSAKMEKVQDEMGRIMYGPSMPGAKMGQLLPYYFDEVLALRVEHNEDSETVRMLQTEGDGTWLAKDRSGKLEKWEDPDLSSIINKILTK